MVSYVFNNLLFNYCLRTNENYCYLISGITLKDQIKWALYAFLSDANFLILNSGIIERINLINLGINSVLFVTSEENLLKYFIFRCV